MSVSVNIVNKIVKLQEIIKDIVRINQKYKVLEIIDTNDLNSCINYAETIYAKLKHELAALNAAPAAPAALAPAPAAGQDDVTNNAIGNLQQLIFEMSTLISLYGCNKIEHALTVCVGHNYIIDEKYKEKFALINEYVHLTKYKIIDWKTISKKSFLHENMVKTAEDWDCFEIESDYSSFHTIIYGVKIVLHNIEKQHTMVMYGIIDDILTDVMMNSSFMNAKMNELINHPPDHPKFCQDSYDRFRLCLGIKDMLIYNIEGLKQQYNLYKDNLYENDKPLIDVINIFIKKELNEKRYTLIKLLINSQHTEYQYLAYLLYDLLSNDVNGVIDTYEQTMLFDSLPWCIKKYFKDAMKKTINYANRVSQIELSKVPLEQQICLMKTDESVKEKAMLKLKEVKMKSEDTGSKARQYLEGLLKIPFGVYKEEPIMRIMRDSNTAFVSLIAKIGKSNTNTKIELPFPIKNAYTPIEIQKYMALLKTQYAPAFYAYLETTFHEYLATFTKVRVQKSITQLKNIMMDKANAGSGAATQDINYKKMISAAASSNVKTVGQLRDQLGQMVKYTLTETSYKTVIYEWIEERLFDENENNDNKIIPVLTQDLPLIDENFSNIHTFMRDMTSVLDKSVFGHRKAKRQIERIIAQWLNGDNTGYCFGFEGPPGVGKTSLAKKGISSCLKDANGVSRPFAFIAMGGSSNSSTLDGHNYTYVGSSWGRIVDILMDTKIMNPIIFIDELDKVSKTENGKEIIGILTHLIDPTQNDSFHDKYFNGINLNLSKALFIFSYNDVEAIDRILLDRIHRIKFDHLTNEDKLVITREYILPEIYTKMGLNDIIKIDDTVIEYIISEYTCEPGVRKLKELMFEIFGELNLSMLRQGVDLAMELPYIITIAEVKNKFLKERREMKSAKIHKESMVGIINGLWANSLGMGGVLPIEASFYPCNTFLALNLTGMQGDVMKESMAVAKSLAWTLFTKQTTVDVSVTQKKIEDSKNQGLHIHVPEGATPKDGPSAGTAITVVMYSLFTNRKIKNDIAITGEICLQGRVTAIGGLDLKILGGIKAGIKTFIYPDDNKKDYDDFYEKYKDKLDLNVIDFISVSSIEQVLSIVFENTV